MPRLIENRIKFPYNRSLGPVIGAFMTGLAEKRILGIRSGDRVIVPPLEWDPDTGAELADDLVEVGPAGTVKSWTWVPSRPTSTRSTPFGFALIRLDGADTPILHAVDAGSSTRCRRHARRAPVEGQRIGHITDIELLRARRGARRRRRRRRPATEPVTMMDFTLDHLHGPGPADARPRRRGRRRGACSATTARCAGARTSAAGATARSTPSSSRGARGRPAPHRLGHQLHDRHAHAVPRPDRDRAVRPGARPARRVDVVLGYQPLIDVPRRRPRRHAGRGRVGVAAERTRPTHRRPTAASWGGSPRASPTSTTRTS